LTSTPGFAIICPRREFKRQVKIMADAVKGYCVKCKAKREMLTPKVITMKNKRKATKGTCPKCGTKMFKIGG
jgi:hypothetical protein